MQVGQLMAGVGIGLGLAAGSIGGWTAFQRGQASEQAVSPVVQYGVQPTVPVSQTVITLTQAENDYLYDLAQALQAIEQRRLNDTERLAIGRQVSGWLESGSDYWQVRSQFDQAYSSAVAGDYAQNREAYIKFATERLAPAFVATLNPPPQVIIKTKTRYVETPSQPQIVEVPGKTRVIRDVVHVPEPYPVPVPIEPEPHHPHHPEHPEPHPDPRPNPPRPHPQPFPDSAQVPDQPAPQPPVAELPDNQPEPAQPEPAEPPSKPQVEPEAGSGSGAIEVGATMPEDATY